MRKALALLTALVSFSCATPPPSPPPPAAIAKTPAPKVVEPVVVDGPREELIKKLDEMVQWRFSKITPEDVRTRRFGANRMGPAKEFHVDNLTLAPAVNSLASEGWAVGFYTSRMANSNVKNGASVRGPVAAAGGAWPATEDRRDIEALALLALTAKAAASGASHGVPLEARLVPASGTICLRCHADKAVGEPIAAVVYAFYRERPSVATPGRESGR